MKTERTQRDPWYHKSIDVGAVNVDVVVEIAPGLEMSSIVTKKSCERLELEVGKQVYLIVKASNVMLGTESPAASPLCGALKLGASG